MGVCGLDLSTRGEGNNYLLPIWVSSEGLVFFEVLRVDLLLSRLLCFSFKVFGLTFLSRKEISDLNVF